MSRHAGLGTGQVGRLALDELVDQMPAAGAGQAVGHGTSGAGRS